MTTDDPTAESGENEEPTELVAIRVPDFGQGDQQIRLVGWLVEQGETVLPGDSLAELLLPGLVYELAAEQGGEVDSLLPAADSGLAAGEIVGWLRIAARGSQAN